MLARTLISLVNVTKVIEINKNTNNILTKFKKIQKFQRQKIPKIPTPACFRLVPQQKIEQVFPTPGISLISLKSGFL